MLTCNLRAALQCVSKQESRSELETVCVEFTGDKIYVTGTDGLALFASAEDNRGGITSGTALIPMAIVAQALKDNARAETIDMERDREWDAWKLGGITFTDTRARYPRWRRVVPQTLSGVVGHFDPALLVRAHKAIGFANGGGLASALYQNGNDAAILRGVSPDAICVVMPLRMDSVLKLIPEKHFLED